MLNKLLILLVTVLLALPLMAEDKIYKTVDEDGNVVYTDQKPSDDAEPVDLPELTIVDPVEIGTAPAPNSNGSQNQDQNQMTFRIVSPTQDETIWNTAYTVDVRLELSTGIPPGAQIALFVDGQLKTTTQSLSATLTEVFRGPHTLRAELQTQNGRVIASTESVNFIIQQQSALRPRPG